MLSFGTHDGSVSARQLGEQSQEVECPPARLNFF